MKDDFFLRSRDISDEIKLRSVQEFQMLSIKSEILKLQWIGEFESNKI